MKNNDFYLKKSLRGSKFMKTNNKNKSDVSRLSKF